MRERHWTIPQLAEACDVATGLAQKWVSVNPRYRSTPSPASCEKIAAALSIDADRILELAGHRKPGEPRAEIDAMRQARREQLEAWVTAVGPENEAYFWSHLTAQAESTARLILELKTAVNQPAGTAVSGAVSDPPKRPRRGRRGTEGPLTVDFTAARLALRCLPQLGRPTLQPRRPPPSRLTTARRKLAPPLACRGVS